MAVTLLVSCGARTEPARTGLQNVISPAPCTGEQTLLRETLTFGGSAFPGSRELLRRGLETLFVHRLGAPPLPLGSQAAALRSPGALWGPWGQPAHLRGPSRPEPQADLSVRVDHTPSVPETVTVQQWGGGPSTPQGGCTPPSIGCFPTPRPGPQQGDFPNGASSNYAKCQNVPMEGASGSVESCALTLQKRQVRPPGGSSKVPPGHPHMPPQQNLKKIR